MTLPVPILMYHSIARGSALAFRRWVVSPELFDAQMSCLREEGFTALTVSELVAGMRDDHLPIRPIAITFDDGFLDFATDALPILMRYGLSSTMYVCTGYVGRTSRWLDHQGEGNRQLLSWENVRALGGAGVEVGAHTRTHPQLDTLPVGKARNEIEGSRRDLEDRLGNPVRSFAYPHGYHSRVVRQLVVEAGYESACAVKHGLSSLSDDRFALARIIVGWGTDVHTLKLWIRGAGMRVPDTEEGLQTRGWRAVRRARARINSRRHEV